MTASRFQTAPPLSPRVRRRRDVITRALSCFAAWSYSELEVPLLARHDPLRTTLGDDLSEQLFRFVDRDGKLLVLRGDMTPVVAQLLAGPLSQREEPLRVCYANRIARVHRAFAREQVESHELGLELIGPGGLSADLEVLVVLFELLDELGVREFEVQLGHVGILEGMLSSHPNRRERGAIATAMTRKDAFAARALLEDPAAVQLVEPLCNLAPTSETLSKLRSSDVGEVAVAASELHERWSALAALGYEDRVRLDLTAADDRGYYTGMHVRVVSRELGIPLAGGGRYDELYGNFGDPRDAVGFGFRVEALVELLEGQDGAVELPEAAVVDARQVDPLGAMRRAMVMRRQDKRVELIHPIEQPEGSDA